ADRPRAGRDGDGGPPPGRPAPHLAGGLDDGQRAPQQPRGVDGQGEGRPGRDPDHAEGGRDPGAARLLAPASPREVDARRQDQRHLRGHAADQPADRRAAHPRLFVEGAVVEDALDPDGLVLNEGWFKGAFSPLRYALDYYRPPHREQVEWSFPIEYRTLRFTTPSPETACVMRVMERVRPRFFYSLHNAGFCGVYFYVSHERPALFAALHRLVASQGLPLHRGEPEVPYLRTLAPAIYALFGIDETYEFMARTL